MEDKISFHQLMAMVWVALLAPAVQLLPSITVESAGRVSWLAPLVVAPILWGLGYLLYNVGGLQAGLHLAWGKIAGNGLILLYIVWGVVLLSLWLRVSAQRLMGAGERDGSLWFLLPALCLLTAWMAWGKRGAFGRTVEVFLAIIAVTIIIVVGLSLGQMEGGNLLPIWWSDTGNLVTALPASLGVLGFGIYAAAFIGEVKWGKGDGRRWIWWSLGGCATLALILLVILGIFGPNLTAMLDSPFFALSKSIGVEGMFQRVEGVVAALWTLCDLAVLGLLLRGSGFLCKGLYPRWKEGYIAPSLLIVAAIGAGWVIPDGYTAQLWSETWAIWGGIVMGWCIPVATIIIVWARGRMKATR